MKYFDDVHSILSWFKVHQERLHAEFGVSRIGVFGSFVTGQFQPGSDIDILVSFDVPTFDHYMDLKFHLEEVLGRSVDLVMEGALKPRLRDHILKEVRYAA